MSSPEARPTQDEFKENSGTEAKKGSPWRRYFARMFDVAMFSSTAALLLAILAYALAPEWTDEVTDLAATGWTGRLLTGVGSVLLALPSIAVLQSWVGTPGKWLFGIEVRSAGGERLPMRSSFHRELLVACKGMAVGVPIAGAILMAMSLMKLTDEGATSWDKQLGSRVTYAPMNVFGYIKASVGGCLVIALIFYDAILSGLPFAGT